MPTEIERAYEIQGYTVPLGWNWDIIAGFRAKENINPKFVPCAVVAGVAVAWGVPFIDGKPLAHKITRKMVTLLATSNTIGGILSCVIKFYGGQAMGIQGERVIRISDGKYIDRARVIEKNGRFRFERVGK